MLSNQASFNRINHTRSHQPPLRRPARPALAAATAGSRRQLGAGNYSHEITAATAYGESELSAPQSATVDANGEVNPIRPEAWNGTGTSPPRRRWSAESALAAGPATAITSTGRPRAHHYQLVGHVKENPNASPTTYNFTS